jgi:hypothetical protein
MDGGRGGPHHRVRRRVLRRGDTRAAGRGFAQSLIRGLTGQLTRGIGGGAFGGVLGGLFGVGLSLLAGRLLGGGRQTLEASPIAALTHFPRLASLDHASNPASRLFGGRATARGPAFRVEVSYRDGAGDIVAAKVATKLGEVNGMNL